MRARARVTYIRRSHLSLTDLNLTVASPTAKPPNLIDRQYFRLYGMRYTGPYIWYQEHILRTGGLSKSVELYKV